MEYLVVIIVALIGSALTLFSGFGLGTLLTPVFALFFPIEVAVATTAIVHFLNNIFKLLLLGKKAHLPTILLFGIPSLIAALAGAWLLGYLSGGEAIAVYTLGEKSYEITVLKLVIAVLLVVFVLFDLLPKLKSLSFDRKYLLPGGLLSGFFGGLSGNQGALRSAFLIKSGLSKEAFIATGVVIACMVDVGRITIYSGSILDNVVRSTVPLIVAATLAAFAGAFAGARLMKKVTFNTVQNIVGILLLVFALLLAAGIL